MIIIMILIILFCFIFATSINKNNSLIGIQTTMPLARPQVPGTLPPVGQSNLNSPMSFPPPSPYHSEYSK